MTILFYVKTDFVLNYILSHIVKYYLMLDIYDILSLYQYFADKHIINHLTHKYGIVSEFVLHQS